MKLAIAQMVLGVLIVVILCYLGGYLRVYLRGYLLLWAYLDFIIPLLLGLSVLGCGIAQFLKARG